MDRTGLATLSKRVSEGRSPGLWEGTRCGRCVQQSAGQVRLDTPGSLSPATVLRKEARTTVQEHATKVERLVGVAYNGMNVDQQRDMAVDTPTLEVAVRIGGEYLQIQPSQGRTAVRAVDDESNETDRVSLVTSETLMTTIMGVMQGLLSQLEKMAVRTEQDRAKKSQEKTTKKCWGFQKEGHLRRDSHPAMGDCYPTGKRGRPAARSWEQADDTPTPFRTLEQIPGADGGGR